MMSKDIGLLTILLSLTCLSLVAVTYLLYNHLLVQEQLLKMTKEQHIINLYTAYKNNMDSCKSLANQSNQEKAFIQENCIMPINNSLVGKGLVDWERSDLLVRE